MTGSCTCGRIAVGLQVTENRNWNPACDAHGLGSVWYEEEGRELHRKRWQDAIEAQRLAREARRKAMKNS